MKNEQILMYTTGSSDEMIEEQYEQCMSLIEQRTGKYVDEDIKSDHLRKLRHRPNVFFRFEEGLSIYLAAERMDIEQPGKSIGPITEAMAGADEMMVASCRGHILQADHIAEYLRKVDEVTIADKRITFARGVDIEHIHRVMASIKERKTTYNGDEILKDSWPGGRPPVGTEVVDGQLIKADNYHDVRELIHRVVFDGMAKSKASREIGCTRKTITNTINKRYELFDIPQQ